MGGSAWNADDEEFHLDIWDKSMMRKSAIRMVFSSVWLGIFAAVAITFGILSTREQRRGPVFFIQCISFPLAITYNLQEAIIGFHRFTGTFAFPDESIHYETYLRVHVLDISLEHFIPLISDLAVLCKIRSFYPHPLYSFRQQTLILLPFVSLLIPRLGLSIANTYAVYRSESSVEWSPDKSFPGILGFNWVPMLRATSQAEYGLQAVYCAGSAIILLYKSLSFTNLRSAQLRRDLVRRRLRFFVEALLMTFIPPFVFSIAAASVLDCPATKYCYYREMAGSVVNTSVLFGLLATTWSSIRVKHDSEISSLSCKSKYDTSAFNYDDESGQFASELDTISTRFGSKAKMQQTTSKKSQQQKGKDDSFHLPEPKDERIYDLTPTFREHNNTLHQRQSSIVHNYQSESVVDMIDSSILHQQLSVSQFLSTSSQTPFHDHDSDIDHQFSWTNDKEGTSTDVKVRQVVARAL
ncbi:uncharacterized protein FA14DRAFT_152896 [Meira miltonrushii]|uniref:Uncharacterized protein n=1 Tax=Meira miltonrushii TaxID=1280837 RepID=A0A316VKD8_9BASI|nr:uncharacterized protein FA14DRAFT_152896 [Meira miltonrushii]PWN37518.1 hypothetical protein FA14DRAFT_152896 [Meira miltonrushii]